MNKTKATLNDELARITDLLKAANFKLGRASSGSIRFLEARGLIHDLHIMARTTEADLAKAPEETLTEKQRAAVAAFAEEAARTHRDAVDRFEAQGDFANARRFAVQSVFVREQSLSAMGLA